MSVVFASERLPDIAQKAFGIFRPLGLDQANLRRRWRPNSVSMPVPRRMKEDGSGTEPGGSVTTTVTKPLAKRKVPIERVGAESSPVNIGEPFNFYSL